MTAEVWTNQKALASTDDGAAVSRNRLASSVGLERRLTGGVCDASQQQVFMAGISRARQDITQPPPPLPLEQMRRNKELLRRLSERQESTLEGSPFQRDENCHLEFERCKSAALQRLAEEIQSPLAALRQVMAALMKRGAHDPLLLRSRQTIAGQIGSLLALSDALKRISHTSAGDGRLYLRPTDLVRIAAQAGQAALAAALQRNISLVVTLTPESLPVLGDGGLLRPVVDSLLQNSIRYTDPGGCVWLSVEREGSEMLLRIEESGAAGTTNKSPLAAGMQAPPVRCRVPEPTTHYGLNLSLPIVRHVVEAHEGNMELTNAPHGAGSSITIRFPALRLLPEPRHEHYGDDSSLEALERR